MLQYYTALSSQYLSLKLVLSHLYNMLALIQLSNTPPGLSFLPITHFPKNTLPFTAFQTLSSPLQPQHHGSRQVFMLKGVSQPLTQLAIKNTV